MQESADQFYDLELIGETLFPIGKSTKLFADERFIIKHI